MSETATRKRTTKKPPQDPLDAFAEAANANPREAIAALLWANRHANPEMSIQVTPAELEKYRKCVDFLEVQPQVRIFRPEGTPPRAAVPAAEGKRGSPSHPGTPPKPYVVIQLVDQDGNTIVPIESTEEDAQLRDKARAKARMKDRAPEIAEALKNDFAQGTTSQATLNEAIILLKTMAQEMR